MSSVEIGLMNFAFLFCSERSGSNFITSIVGGHEEVSGPPPSHLFRLFGLNCQNYFPTSNDENWNAFKEDFVEATQNMLGDWDSDITEDELDAACPNRFISEALDHLYAQERRPTEQLSFVKENYAYSFTPFLLANWPDAKFVYQVRDPRDVATSWIKTSATPGGVAEAIDNWQRDQQETLRIYHQLQSTQKILLVRYEDMLIDPEETALKICNHLGLNYSPSMLEFHKDSRIKRNAAKIPAWENLAKPIMANNHGKYKAVLSADDIRYIELRCFKLMREFGYELDTDIESLSAASIQSEIAELQERISKNHDQTVEPERTQITRDRRGAIIERVKNRAAAAPA